VQRKVYSTRTIGTAKAAAVRAEGEVRMLTQKLAKCERDREAFLTQRVIAGALDDGRVIEIRADGAGLSGVADTMQPKTPWRVAGVGKIVSGKIEIKPTGITPADGGGGSPAAPGGDEPVAASALAGTPPPAAVGGVRSSLAAPGRR
jgi:hypothetical protein